MRRLFSISRAPICWRAVPRLRAAGIDTIYPVAIMEERHLKFLRGRSYLVYEFIAGESLRRVLLREGGNTEQYIENAAAIVNKLTHHGIVHGDLKANNFIVNGDHIALVDLDGAWRGQSRSLAADLDNDRRRFLKNWINHPHLLRRFKERLDAGDSSTRGAPVQTSRPYW